jgi:hypothetical protein
MDHVGIVVDDLAGATDRSAEREAVAKPCLS